MNDDVTPGHTSTHAEVFTGYRPLLFTIAYEILGSAAEAEDVVQETYIRWATVDLDGVADVKAYLAKIATRQALNAVRSRSRSREEYVGPWLPEPLLLTDHDAIDDVLLAESVSTAMLVVLDTLGPDERVVFVLREVFGFRHDEIADIVGKSVAAVRQTAHRARDHVQARRPRFEPTSTAQAEKVIDEFLRAAVSGDLDGLLDLLAPDVVYRADSGGKASAARRPVAGADKVAALFVGLMRIGAREPDLRIEVGLYGALPGLLVAFGGQTQLIMSFRSVQGRIHDIYVWRNPDKLTAAEQVATITR